MTTFECLVLGCLLLFAVILFIYYTKSKKKISKLLFGAGSGVVMLFPAYWILSALGYSFTINIFTVSISVVLGIPGVILVSALSFL